MSEEVTAWPATIRKLFGSVSAIEPELSIAIPILRPPFDVAMLPLQLDCETTEEARAKRRQAKAQSLYIMRLLKDYRVQCQYIFLEDSGA